MDAIEQITQDLNWREAEIASFRIILRSVNVNDTQRRALLRAAWAMLYAHYEGFCKFCFQVFYDEISRRGLSFKDLPDSTRLFSMKTSLNRLRNMTPNDLLREIENDIPQRMTAVAEFPEVDTESNLSHARLKAMLSDADIELSVIDEKEVNIKTLVARRNGIAHGEKNFIEDVDYYISMENIVYDIMYNLAFEIDNRLNISPYK